MKPHQTSVSVAYISATSDQPTGNSGQTPARDSTAPEISQSERGVEKKAEHGDHQAATSLKRVKRKQLCAFQPCKKLIF